MCFTAAVDRVLPPPIAPRSTYRRVRVLNKHEISKTDFLPKNTRRNTLPRTMVAAVVC